MTDSLPSILWSLPAIPPLRRGCEFGVDRVGARGKTFKVTVGKEMLPCLLVGEGVQLKRNTQ